MSYTKNVGFSFSNDTNGFTPTEQQNLSMSFGGQELNDTPTGSPAINGVWTRTLTFEDMGVPAGSTVIGIHGCSIMGKLVANSMTNGVMSVNSDMERADGSGGLTTLSFMVNFGPASTPDSTFQVYGGQRQSGWSLPSNTLVKINITTTGSCGGGFTYAHRWLCFTLDYD